MGMGLSMRLRLVIPCRACNGTIDEHEEGCPFPALAKYEEKLRRWTCPEPLCKCEAGAYSVEEDTDDYLTCRVCMARFSAGMTGDVWPDVLTLLPRSDSLDDVVIVKRFKVTPKRRGFRWKSDVVRAQFRASIKLARQAKRAKARKTKARKK